MTKQSNYPVIEISKSPVLNFIEETKETLAVSFIHNNNKTFRTVDLWNIQRQKKRRVQPRMLNRPVL